MRIAAVQMDADAGDVAARLAVIEAQARRAKGEGAELVVFPELATTGYGAGEAVRAAADGVGGPTLARLREIARDLDIGLVAGLPLERGGAVCNSAVFVAPEGVLASYDKIHLYGDYEKALFTPGRERPPVVTWRDLRFGLLICFDVEFPERVRDLARRGADAVLVPTALPWSGAAAFIASSMIPVRAFENQLFVVYADHAGKDGRFRYQGCSCIAAPDGSALARAGAEAAEIIAADLDPAAYAACRAQNPYLDELEAAKV